MNKRISLNEMAPVIIETLDNNGTVSFISAGTSMMPTIRNRKDTITLKKVDGKLKKGDIPFYRRDNGQYILHRIIFVNDGTYVTRGDNQWDNEYNVRQDQVIGVLTSFERNGKIHNVDDISYKLYIKLLPVVRYGRKYYYSFKSKVYNFIKYLTNK